MHPTRGWADQDECGSSFDTALSGLGHSRGTWAEFRYGPLGAGLVKTDVGPTATRPFRGRANQGGHGLRPREVNKCTQLLGSGARTPGTPGRRADFKTLPIRIRMKSNPEALYSGPETLLLGSPHTRGPGREFSTDSLLQNNAATEALRSGRLLERGPGDPETPWTRR
jgi:hypothetical protein